ncbi:hypothetical protein [Campylobacter sp. RM16187]|uniref:hypothetical protein n=1 Tax=Campylobacter sp. RM16187 TaxID=1660063 RepID=UPI0021B689BE|nr:hypothetical protein [Campylobacter sp. RM16187]QKG29083.1 putative membrane protein [Campylobacter sp. RM16187]
MKENLTNEKLKNNSSKELFEKAKQEGIFGSSFLGVGILTSNAPMYFDNGTISAAMSIMSAIYLYKALKKFEQISNVSVHKFYKLSLIFSVIFLISYIATEFYSLYFAIPLAISAVCMAYAWFISTLKLANITRISDFKLYLILLTIDIIFALYIRLAKIDNEILIYTEFGLLVIIQIIYISAWAKIENIKSEQPLACI